MKKYVLLTSFILLLTGCAQVTQPDVVKEKSTESSPVDSSVTPVEVTTSSSPLSALLEHVQLGKSDSEYPRITNIRIVSDAKAGFHPDSFTVTYTEEGFADDEINKSEEELKLQKQNDGIWKVIDKKITKQECHPGRCKEVIPNAKIYTNSTYGFQFQYPENVTVENGGNGIYFKFKEPLVTVKNENGDTLFTVGTTNYFSVDATSKKYILKSLSSLIPLKENCTKPFFGNDNIMSAEMSFGEGVDWSVFYNILTNQNVGLGIETYRMERPGSTAVEKKVEQDRIDAEKQILSTLNFGGTAKAVNFSCK